MPERVTREERTVSLAIEKARSAKEELLASLNDNNRSDLEKDNIMDKVKVTRPKTEKDKSKKYSEGKHSGFGLGQNKTAGQVTEFKKGNLREQAKDMKKPMNLREQAKDMKYHNRGPSFEERLDEYANRMRGKKTLAEQAKEFKKSLDILKETIRGQGARTGNPVLDREKEEEVEYKVPLINEFLHLFEWCDHIDIKDEEGNIIEKKHKKLNN